MKKILLLQIILTSYLFIAVSSAISEDNLNDLFLKAVAEKNYEEMKVLIKKGANINCSVLDGKYTSLSSAASTGDLKLAKFLLKNGADIKGNSLFPNSPIYLAIGNNHPEMVSYLLEKGVNPNFAWNGENEGTLLIGAVQFGYLSAVKLLVDKGADINFTGNTKYSPLYRAIIYDRFDVFEFLISHEAKLNKCDNEALTAIKWKSIKKNQKYVQMLESIDQY